MMVERPERYVPDIAKAGADSITIHVEATPHVHYALDQIRQAGCTAGAAITPATPIDTLAEVARETLDLALCMSVNPGWGGQSFIPHSLDKLERMRRRCHPEVALEVDGGVNQRDRRPRRPGGRQPAGHRLGRVRLRRSGRGLRADRRAAAGAL